jgi:hypothetical protein
MEAGAHVNTIRGLMNTQRARQKWFPCFSPDGLLARQDAVNLIHKHAAKARVFEDVKGLPALLVTENSTRRLVLFSDLTDAQIRHELPTAWLREHQQRDMFRDESREAADVPPRRKRLRAWGTLKRVFAPLFN